MQIKTTYNFKINILITKAFKVLSKLKLNKNMIYIIIITRIIINFSRIFKQALKTIQIFD